MRKIIVLAGLGICLAACGARDHCTAPPQPKLMTVKDLSLVDKANILGVPPEQVPGQPKSASSYGALVGGMNDSAAAESDYATHVDRKNATLRRNYCVENEAYKARSMKDDMSTLAHAVAATCGSDDEPAILAALLKYRNCASGR